MNTFRIAAFAIAAAIAACSSAPAATLSIADTTVSAVEARDGVMVTLGYQITSDSALTALLGASMTGPASEVVKDDIPAGVSVAVQPGTNWYYRSFRINLPPYASTGASVFYDITYTVRWDASESASLKRNDVLKMLAPVPVRVPILMYHKIGDALYSQYWNTTDMLRAQLAALRAYGYTALTCQELMDIRAGLAPAPAKPILLTFDGGYQNFWLDAIPILMQHDYRAVMFLLTGVMGTDNSWDGDNNPVIMFMTWDEVTSAYNTGYMDLQSHSVTHPDLRYSSSAARAAELVNSRTELQTRYGAPVDYFCYPYGAYNDTVKRAVRDAGYFAAFGAWGGVEPNCADKYALKRVPIYWDTTTDYNPAAPSSFFFRQIGDPLPVPTIAVTSIELVDAASGIPLPSGQAHLGQSMRIRVTANNSGVTASACARLVVDSDSDATNGAIYDSHLAPTPQDVSVSGWSGQAVFEWVWTPPVDAPAGPCWLTVRFQDPLCVLGFHRTGPAQLLTLTSSERTLSDVVGAAAGEYVTLRGNAASAAFDGAFYIQNAGRSRGLRVEMPGHSIAAGSRVDVAGRMDTNVEGERCLMAGSAKTDGQAPALPLTIRCSSLGGASAGLQEAVGSPEAGPNNVGLLVRAWGRVLTMDPEVGEMVIDDGSGSPTRCMWEEGVAVDPGLTHVLLTGVSSCWRDGDRLQPRILVTSASAQP